MSLKLISERLILSPLSMDDIDLSLEMFTDPEVVEYIGGVMSEDEIRDGMATWTRRGGDGCIGIWCISDRLTQEKYGDCYLLPLPIDDEDTDWDLVRPEVMPYGEIEVGYFLKRSCWGKGIATEVCRRLLKFAFEETSLVELVATLDDKNHQSRKVLEKSGFLYKGRIWAYAEDSPAYRIDRQQWLSLSKDKLA